MKNKKIVLITGISGFPDGYGAASIIRKYVRGFERLGYASDVLLLRPSEAADSAGEFNSLVKGRYYNANFEYMCQTTKTAVSRLARMRLYIRGVFRTAWFLICERKNIERVFYYSPDHVISVFCLTYLLRILKIRCVGIKTESRFRNAEEEKRLLNTIRERMRYRGFSSMIVITDYLKAQVRRGKFKGNIFVLPIVVDEAMFDGFEECQRKKELVYMGTLGHQEELLDLLRIYQIVHENHQDWELVIIGEFTNEEIRRKVRNTAEELNINEGIKWLGKLDAGELLPVLAQGGIMLLPRVDMEYSKAGFPIKLGEYLISGAPTVVTGTGDIPRYLMDNKNAFVAKPGDVYDFANKIEKAIGNYQKALQIGKAGKETAIKYFGSQHICTKMMEY